MQRKGKDHEEIENFTKYVLCSNNETRFIYTQEDEVRFWVRKIDPIPEEDAIPDILPVLGEEIPGFLSFLLSRQMHIREAQSRMWFKPEDIETEALIRLKAENQPVPVKAIKRRIHDLFLDYPAEEYLISVNILKMMVSDIERMSSETIIAYLRTNLNLSVAVNEEGISKTRYLKIPYSFESSNGTIVNSFYKDRGKPFVFHAERFLSEVELEYVRKVIKANKMG